MQKGLDEYIAENHDLGETEMFEEVILAILVELGELANETRCFKFWSKKERSNREVILEEYVDNIHFLLSLGLSKGYAFSTIITERNTRSETNQFLEVFNDCLLFYKNPSEENYLVIFKSYLQLAEILEFSDEDIQRAYHNKNEVNYKRQQTGY